MALLRFKRRRGPGAEIEPGGEDRQLVRRMLAGDGAAFDQFFDDNFAGLYRFALIRVGQDADLADEIVQATLCKAIDRLAGYRGEAALFSWLCMICRNLITDHYRRNQRGPHIVELAEEVPEIRAALELLSGSEAPQPEGDLRRKEVARWVRVTLDSLSPRYRHALEWKYLHGLSVNEIAGRLDVGPKAAESIMSRARKAFREGFHAISRQQQTWAFER
ncbi:MAG: sigma-70 family RNA polymerase sigma factor [Acidobacteriota bacterium]